MFVLPGFENVNEVLEHRYERRQDSLRCMKCANRGHGCHGAEGPCGAFRPHDLHETKYR